MGLGALFFIAIGLSMDAFAAAVCRGLQPSAHSFRQAVLTAAFFGGFQAAMPVIGWVLGKQFERYIVGVDHWIAFVLLVGIGCKMLLDALKEDADAVCEKSCFNLKEVTALAVATSIDALAVGVTFAFLQTDIRIAAALIGCTTFSLSALGVLLGSKLGTRSKRKAETAGGVILILIGVKILLEHLAVRPF